MNHQAHLKNTRPSYGSPSVIEELADAYIQGKSGIFHVTCDNQKVIFSKFRPHEVRSFGIAFKDVQTGVIRTISEHQRTIIPFSILFRTKKGHESACIVFEDGIELSSDGPTDFVAYFCVKMKELEDPVLYTISKHGTDTYCTENLSFKRPLPVHFCYAAFHLLEGLKND